MTAKKNAIGFSRFIKYDWNKWERRTIEKMVALYCRKNHIDRTKKSFILKKDICEECSALLEYSVQRIEKCQFGVYKSNCSDCTVHCFKPDMREAVRKAMRYSGPRMLFHYPLTALVYIYRKKRS